MGNLMWTMDNEILWIGPVVNPDVTDPRFRRRGETAPQETKDRKPGGPQTAADWPEVAACIMSQK